MSKHKRISKALERHRPAEDWHCVCGEDCFGGTAAYSWDLLKCHVASEILAALKKRKADA